MTGLRVKLLVVLGCAALFVSVAGCEDGGDDDRSEGPPTVDVTGTWIAVTTAGERATLIMTQDGAGVTGTFSSNFGSRGTLTGTVSGNTLQMTLNETNFDRIVTEATATVSGNTMNGRLTQSDGDSGRFTATRQ